MRLSAGVRSSTVSGILCVLAALAVLLLAACGGSSKPTRSTSSAASTSTAATADASGATSPGLSANTQTPSGNVASVDGTPITYVTYKHWVTAAVEQQAAASKGSPVILPLWPSRYAICTAAIDAKLPSVASKSEATKVTDCAQEFTSVNTSVLDFLIKSDWYQAYAAHLGITITAAKVAADFHKSITSTFKTTAAYRSFLTRNGETPADIRFRIKVGLIYAALVKKVAPTAKTSTAAGKLIDAGAAKLLRARTQCAAEYSVSTDCAS